MRFARTTLTLFCLFFLSGSLCAEILEVKTGRSAIVKVAPTGTAQRLPNRLPAGTRVDKIGEVTRYYSIRTADGTVGWSYKGNFKVVSDAPPVNDNPPVTKEGLLARSDVLKIIVVDVEVGDATIIIAPEEDGERDVILIDTGENDADRIRAELIANGIPISGKPFDRFIVTHYDHDHMGDALSLIPLSEIVYDHGDNNIKSSYRTAVIAPTVDRRLMTLDYQEDFSGGMSLECVAVNRATDFEPGVSASTSSDNPNSIALVLSFDGFDYFTGGDLTKKPERSLATGIRNCDAYHVNHHGSRATSSVLEFVRKLDPEVSVASNGTRYGHPTRDVAQRLIGIGSKFYQTNNNEHDSRANNPDRKFVADDTNHDDSDLENAEGAKGTIIIVVDPVADKYYVIMPGLPLAEATFDIER